MAGNEESKQISSSPPSPSTSSSRAKMEEQQQSEPKETCWRKQVDQNLKRLHSLLFGAELALERRDPSAAQVLGLRLIGFLDSQSRSDVDEAFIYPIRREAAAKVDAARRSLTPESDRPLCWAEHMSLDNETRLDRSGIRVSPVSGLVAADYFAPGYFVWAVLIANLAPIGYEEKNMYMAVYDWRLSFQNTEVRDQTLSSIKSNIELLVATNGGNKVVVIPHSMGVLYFLHFMKWVEAPAPMGGGGGSNWCAKHIKAVMNIGAPFLGVPKAVAGLFSIEAKDIAVARAFTPGVLDKDVFGLQTLQHMMRMSSTWDSTLSMIPKGGDTIWGGLDWSPEGYFNCSAKKLKNNDTDTADQNRNGIMGG